MKMKKRVISMFLVLTMLSCLVACGNSTPAIGNDVVSIEESSGESSTEESTEASTEIVESSSAEATKEDSTEVKAEDAETTETKPVEKPTTTPAVPTSTPSPEPTATPEPHVHQYKETVTRQPSCNAEGEKQLVCQGCGDVKVEAIPATGNHNWVEGTTVIHHEALGHVETVITQTGVGETKHEYVCAVCNYCTDTPDALAEHRASYVSSDRGHATARTIIYDIPGEPIYEETQVWVVDSDPWDESVGNGVFTCIGCGATK